MAGTQENYSKQLALIGAALVTVGYLLTRPDGMAATIKNPNNPQLAQAVAPHRANQPNAQSDQMERVDGDDGTTLDVPVAGTNSVPSEGNREADIPHNTSFDTAGNQVPQGQPQPGSEPMSSDELARSAL